MILLSTTAMDTSPLKDASLEMNAESYNFTFVKKENLIVPND